MRNRQRFRDADHHTVNSVTLQTNENICVHVSVEILIRGQRLQIIIAVVLDLSLSRHKQITTIIPEGTSGLRETCCLLEG